MNFKEKALAIHERMIEDRRDIHSHPEVSFKEFRTSQKIKDFLTASGIEILPIHSDTSVVGIIRGGKPGKTFALRADIDALPMEEKNDVPYKSTNVGVMHSCGHDAHAAALMGVATLLNDVKADLKGNVKLIFQAAEELVPGGASGLVKAGVMDDVDGVMAFHVNSNTPVGKIGFRPGPSQASADGFKLTVTGVGGHGAHPENCIDPVVISAQIINSLQTIISRNLSGPQAGIITIGSIHGGTKSNIIADDVVMEATVRTLDPKVRELLPKRIEEIVRGAEIAYNCKCTLEMEYGYPVLINNADFINKYAIPACSQIIGEENVFMIDEPGMGSEDFSYFLEKAPGTMGSLGSGNVEKGITIGGHNCMFDIDEEALWIGAAGLAQTAWQFLNEEE